LTDFSSSSSVFLSSLVAFALDVVYFGCLIGVFRGALFVLRGFFSVHGVTGGMSRALPVVMFVIQSFFSASRLSDCIFSVLSRSSFLYSLMMSYCGDVQFWTTSPVG
jgi:hypothetical protein